MADLDTVAAGADDARQTADVNRFWQDLGLPGLIDIHTHFMPANVMAKVWSYFEQGRAELDQPWPIAYRRSERERLDLLRTFGVRRFGALNYPHKPGMAAWLNSWSEEFAARTPDALHSATFFPEPEAAAYVDRAIGSGARIFKAHLQVGAYDPRDPALAPVWTMLAGARVPVIVHCGSGPVPGPYTGPGPIGEVLAVHPGLIVIVAHMGAPEYEAFASLADRYEGVYLDTTMAFTDFFGGIAPFPRALVPRLAALGEKILLGSDFPNIPYPYVRQLQGLERLGLGEDWLRGVCYHNAARLLGLEPDGGPPPGGVCQPGSM